MIITPENIQEIYTKYSVSPERAKHSLGVAKIARKLAVSHDINPEEAWLAGALHDIARDFSDATLNEYATAHQFEITDEERRFPPLLHGKVAADIAINELGIHNKEILSAIKHHTSGKADMTTLETILYLSDFLESTENMPEYQAIRDKLHTSLRGAVNLVNKATKEHIESQGYKPTEALLENMDFYSKYSN